MKKPNQKGFAYFNFPKNLKNISKKNRKTNRKFSFSMETVKVILFHSLLCPNYVFGILALT